MGELLFILLVVIVMGLGTGYAATLILDEMFHPRRRDLDDV